jgi:hypothetical protein
MGYIVSKNNPFNEHLFYFLYSKMILLAPVPAEFSKFMK